MEWRSNQPKPARQSTADFTAHVTAEHAGRGLLTVTAPTSVPLWEYARVAAAPADFSIYSFDGSKENVVADHRVTHEFEAANVPRA